MATMTQTSRHSRQDELLAVPMSSMIDVVFLLLIFFIATMGDELLETSFSVAVPTAQRGKVENTDNLRLDIVVEPQGYTLKANGKDLADCSPLKQISDSLAGYSAQAEECRVSVSVSPVVEIQKVVFLLDVLKYYGFSHLSMRRTP